MGAPFGDGHMTAARAVGRLLRTRVPGLSVAVADISAGILPRLRLDQALRVAYRWSATRWGGRPHYTLYRIAGRWPGIICALSHAALGRVTAAWLRRAAPDLVIATHPVAAYLCARAARPDLPVVTLVTDSGAVNPIWFHGRYAATLLTDPGTVPHVARIGGSPARVGVVGPPVASALDRRPDRREARARLRLDDRLTVLFTAGGAGLGRGVLTAARALAAADVDVQLILNAGDSSSLLRGFTAIGQRRSCLVCGRTEKFDQLLAACDLVVGKAGWFTLNEAVLAGRPTLIVDVVPGQEESNADVAEALGVARRMAPREIVPLVRRYAGMPERLALDFTLAGPAELVAGWPDRLLSALHGLVPVPATVSRS